MNHLLRELAPITDSGWQLLEDEAKERLTPALAARKLVDFSGPHGWKHSATNLGRTAKVASTPIDGISARQRRVLPLVELRAEFELAFDELRDGDRGAADVDLAPLDAAAHRIAIAENVAVLSGWQDTIVGIAEASSQKPVKLAEGADGYTRAVATAVERLLEHGVGGPYALALGGDKYREVTETAEHGGLQLFKHLRDILDGPIVWAPGLQNGVVVSLRGGDFLYESGQDISIGYVAHDLESVRLYLEESFSFQVATAEASVVLTP
jgi:uncharacterized linocin/CFP29 family protein